MAQVEWRCRISAIEDLLLPIVGPPGVQRVTVDRKIGRHEVTFPGLILRQSTVPDAGPLPHQHAGLGVILWQDESHWLSDRFPANGVPRNTWLSEYSGITDDWATAQVKRARGEHTHSKGLEMFHGCVLDSRPCERLPIDYFVDNHRLGGLMNTQRTYAQCNAEFVQKDSLGFYHYPGSRLVDQRIFVRVMSLLCVATFYF